MSKYFLKDVQAVLRGLSQVLGQSSELQIAETKRALEFVRSVPWPNTSLNLRSNLNVKELPSRVGSVLRGVGEYSKIGFGSLNSVRYISLDHTSRYAPDKIRRNGGAIHATNSHESSGSLHGDHSQPEDAATEAAKRAEKFMNPPVAPMDPEDKNNVVNPVTLGATPDKLNEEANAASSSDFDRDSSKTDKYSMSESEVDITTQDLKKKINSSSSKKNRDMSSTSTNSSTVHQTLGSKSKERKVPASRAARLATFGGLAAGLGFGAVAEVTRRTLGFGKKGVSLLDKSAFLTDANAERIVDTLCRVRGAALKLGQMLSIQDTSLLNPQVQQIFERVRQSADFMPKRQMESIMDKELGADWRSKFSEFSDKPFAAASIGEVHLGKLIDGREVAIKIQYPGVAEGIDSDIKNLMGILGMWNIFPKGMYMDELMRVARTELTLECDYLREAEYGRLFRKVLKDDSVFYVPEVIDDLSTKKVLTTEYVYGETLDKAFDLDQETRNFLAKNFLRLCFEELFIHRLMQTDPNWANFLYDADKRKINLLDFGASRKFDKKFIDSYIQIIYGASTGNRDLVLKNSQKLGFLTGYESKALEKVHIDAVMILGEPFKTDAPFDFGHQNITERIHSIIPVMAEERLTPPPEQSYSLHRKIAGAFLLCANMRANIACKKVFDDIYDKYKALAKTE